MANSCPACAAVSKAHSPVGRKNGHELVCCRICQTVFVEPMPSGETLSCLYDHYRSTAKYLRKRDGKVRRALWRLRLLPIPRGARFLDVGCNAGFAVSAALRLGLDAHGIDVDGEAIRQARTWLPPERFSAISVQEYVTRGERADVIYMSEVLEHVPHPESVVAAISAILNPRGLLYLTCPDAGHFLRPSPFTDWKECKPPEHLVYYTRQGLRALFGRHGFERIRFRPHTKPSHRMTARKPKDPNCDP